MTSDLAPWKKRIGIILFTCLWRRLKPSIHRVPKRVWWAVVAVVALHIYFFQELIAAYLIFTVLFGSLLVLLFTVYLASEAADRALDWMEANSRVAVKLARQQWSHAAILVQENLHGRHHGQPVHRIG